MEAGTFNTRLLCVRVVPVGTLTVLRESRFCSNGLWGLNTGTHDWFCGSLVMTKGNVVLLGHPGVSKAFTTQYY